MRVQFLNLKPVASGQLHIPISINRFAYAERVSTLYSSQWTLAKARSGLKRKRELQQTIHCTSTAAPSPITPSTSSDSGIMRRMWLHIRAVTFGLFTFGVATPCFLLMVLISPFVFIFDRHRRRAYACFNTIWATISAAPFFKVKIEGKENLPSAAEPAVYVANHQSYTDIFALFFLNRPLKFISKSSVFLFPFIGWSMFLTGHIRLVRSDRASQLKCLHDCQSRLSNGVPIIIFPEGTRSSDKTIRPFKKGAFTIACKSGVPIVPVTINGTGDVMPKGKETLLYPGGIRVTVHPRISTRERNAADICEEAFAIISSALDA